MTQGANRVLIAGAGIAGLATALAFAKLGRASDVLERVTDISDAGAGIQLGPNGVRILQSLGVAGHLSPDVVAPAELTVHDAIGGGVLSALPLGDAIARRLGAPYWVAHRGDLRAALLQAAATEPLITLTPGFDVAGITDSGDAVQAASAAGEMRHGALLVGADGQWSRVRRLLFGDTGMPFSGYVAYRAVVPFEEVQLALRDNAVHIWLAPQIHAVHYPVRAGREHALIVILEEDGPLHGWNTEADASHLRERTSGLAGAIATLIAPVRSWRKWALSDPEPLPHWSKGRVTLIGDAAHPILPFLAQGGSLALEDAATLAAGVADDLAQPVTALANWERRRQPRAKRVQSAARRNGRVYHLAGLSARARDMVLRSSSPSRVITKYDWLYGWREHD